MRRYITAVNQERDKSLRIVDEQEDDLNINKFTSQTQAPGVFAGGDASPWSSKVVISAIADGKRAASSIDRYLGGSGELNKGETIEIPELAEEEVEEHLRFPIRHLPVEQCLDNFCEISCGYQRLDAMAESLRCLHCDRR